MDWTCIKRIRDFTPLEKRCFGIHENGHYCSHCIYMDQITVPFVGLNLRELT